jgi:outer membrane protein assembly factor BamB
MKHRLAPLACLVLAACLSGCSTWSWNPLVTVGIMSEPANKPAPLGPVTASVLPKAVWITQVGKASGFGFRPDVEAGRVYAASAEGPLTVLEVETGKVVTRADTQKKLSSGVEVGEGRIIVGTLKGEVLAYDVTTGKQVWATAVQGEVIAPASVSRKVVVVRTADGRIFGLSLEDGKRRWVFQRPMPSLLLRSEAGVKAIDANVIAGFANGKMIALDLEDGSLTWEVTVAQPRGATDLERIADVAGLPLVDGNNVCAAAFQAKVACFEIQSRNQIWSRDLSSALALGGDARYVYVVDDKDNVHALDKSTGASVWKQDKLLHRKLTAPMVVAGAVVVGDSFGYLHVLSTEDGKLIGRLATDGSAILSMVPAAGGAAVQTAKGAVALVRF